jgi:ATP synthase subunit 6
MLIYFSPLEQFIINIFVGFDNLFLAVPWIHIFFFSNINLQLILLLLMIIGFNCLFLSFLPFFFPFKFVIFFFINFVKNFVGENFSKYGKYFLNFKFFLFIFLVFANLSGMVPYSFAVTSHFVITLFFSFLIFFTCLSLGFYFYGLTFFQLFFPPGAPFFLIFFLISIELISFTARLFSLAIRLFANIMSGHTLLKILATFSWQLVILEYMFFLGFFPFLIVFLVQSLENIIGILQAYVFTVLATIYTNEAFYLH